MSHPASASDRRRTGTDPDSPTDLTGPTKVHVLRRTLREFSRDQCTDLAAGLTYYAVLAIFPALVALLSLIGLVGKSQETVDTVLGILRDAGAGGAADSLEPTLTSLSTSSAATLVFIISILGALWSASGYVNAFSRSMNSLYGKAEGRPVWKLRPIMLAVTLLLVVLVALVMVGLVVSGPVASSIGSTIGLGSAAVRAWSIAKWPVMLLIVVVIVAILYYATPNVRPPKLRWVSLGAVLAILTWVVASALFGFYVANFSSYDKTYGAFAGAIIFLLWLWITNVALLFGAELDAELERGRELQAGEPAEEEIQLPHRDTTKIEKDAAKNEKMVAEARAVRTSRGDDRG